MGSSYVEFQCIRCRRKHIWVFSLIKQKHSQLVITVDGPYTLQTNFSTLSTVHLLASHIGGFRNSQNDVILAHAHIGGRQCIGQPHWICVKCGLIFLEKWGFIANVMSKRVCFLWYSFKMHLSDKLRFRKTNVYSFKRQNMRLREVQKCQVERWYFLTIKPIKTLNI